MNRTVLAGGPPPPSVAAQRAPLRVGVLLAARQLPAWQHAALHRIAASGYADLALVVLLERNGAVEHEAQGALMSALRRALARLDAKIICEQDALTTTDATELLCEVPTLGADAAGSAAEALLPYNLDVVIDFAHADWAAAAGEAVRYGAWRWTQPYSASRDAAEASFWPVYKGWTVGEAVLEQLRGEDAPVVLARAAPATNPYSLKLNASAMCWRMASFLPHKLRQLHELGIDALAQTESAGRVAGAWAAQAREEPGPLELAGYIGRNVARRARSSLARRLTLDQWILMFHLGEALCTTPSRFEKIVPPKDRFWADPHVVSRDGRFYVYMEELPFATGKGHISVLAIGEDGRWEPPTPVLERDYHLSYPFVFEHEGILYMVPESEANRTIDLYRCTDFPARWEFVTTLIKDVAATDTTLLRRGGRWWLFTNLLDTAGASYSEELYIFYSDELIGGEWKPHALNPVISDARRSRPAGAIIERDGRLLRPAQDCSRRYGYGIRLHEIERLSEREFRETEVERIDPTWDHKIVATHTLSYTAGLTVIDALQPRLRF